MKNIGAPMSTSDLSILNGFETEVIDPKDWDTTAKYRFHILLIPEESGEFSAIVLNLPGVGSCGATEEEAMKNVKEAIAGAIESFQEDGEDIPWVDSTKETIPAGTTQKWILLDG
jgi:predicted RNase H-like HicB family nuclease